MAKYYINHKTSELIVYDEEDNEILVLPEITQVEFAEEGFDEEGGVEKKEEKPKKRGRPRKIKPKKEKSVKPQKGKGIVKKDKLGRKNMGSVGFDEETLNKIQRLVFEGKKPPALMEELGISNGAAYKYYKKFKNDSPPPQKKEVTIEEKVENHHKDIIKKTKGKKKPKTHGPGIREQAKRLKDGGMENNEIANELGIEEDEVERLLGGEFVPFSPSREEDED